MISNSLEAAWDLSHPPLLAAANHCAASSLTSEVGRCPGLRHPHHHSPSDSSRTGILEMSSAYTVTLSSDDRIFCMGRSGLRVISDDRNKGQEYAAV